KFEYHWQWAYHDRFKEAGLMALLGSGFDPGVTSVFTMWLKKHRLKTIRQLDILDCNGGDHGQAFATNFNPEINIREVTAPARHWENGEWIETPAMQVKTQFDFDEVGKRNAYLMYHEELESLSKFIPELERARFWMTFGDEYIKHLTVLQNVGMTGIEPIRYQGKDIIPLQFLAAVLPKPETLGETTKGKTNIGVIATGEALDGSGEKTFYINNICDHEDAYAETGNQAVSYTTGVPAMIGSALIVQDVWSGDGVFNMEQMDPDPFMEMLNEQGLPWNVREMDGPVGF
ncbi:MAG: saccharopine dehydrogenase family protein, partial [Alteripontixanthobacter sp.]